MNSSELLLERVEELTWALVDDHIDEAEIAQLETLLLENESARKTYVECMQMHADLHFMFNQKAGATVRSGSSRLPAAVVNALPMASAAMPIPGAHS
ncbi:MAG: hypothetical protein WD030_09690 [Pirellulales bacterium]